MKKDCSSIARASQYQLSDGVIAVLVSNFGCRILKLFAPDREGISRNILLSYQELFRYENDEKYAGAAVGRVANLITDGSFPLDGQLFTLPRNALPHHLHGGSGGFSNVLWRVLEVTEHHIVFSRRFSEAEDFYPGDLDMKITYSLPGNGVLKLCYEAVCSKKTPVSFTNHAYFNLDGDLTTSIHDYRLQIAADRFLGLTSQAVPSGEVHSVEGTVLDFRSPRSLSHMNDPTLSVTRGYDHTLLFSHPESEEPKAAAFSPKTGRRIQVFTDLPAIQLYTSNYPEQGLLLEHGIPDQIHNAVCLETQYATDFVHYPHFPGKYLLPGEQYRTETALCFDVVP